MSDLATTLTAAERDLLAECEARIERGMRTFIEVGSDLATIRNNRLYRGTHDSFEAYAADMLAISRARAYELMAAAAVVSGMPDIGVPVANARQAVELARVPEDERAAVWAAAVDSTGGKPTAAAVRAIVNERNQSAAVDTAVTAIDVPAGSDTEVPHGDSAIATTDRPEDNVPDDDRDAEPASVGLVTSPPGDVPPQDPVAAGVSAATGGDPRRLVEAAMDRFLEPDPDGPHREWRNAYMARLVAGHQPMGVDVAEFVEHADDTCYEELGRLAREVTNFHERVRTAWLARYGDNVIAMRGAR